MLVQIQQKLVDHTLTVGTLESVDDALVERLDE